MANRVIRILPRTLFNFSVVPASQTIALGIAGPIDVSEYSEITAYVRFHPGTVVANEPNLAQVQWYANGTTDEDPAALTPLGAGFAFQVLTAVTGFASSFKSGTTSGFMLVTQVPASSLGRSLNVALVVTAGVAGALQLIMSIDLICKNRDPGPRDLEEERDPILSEVMD
ncbi:MAG: hypothetical protein U0234_07545 [Sandaracinus sp.]